MCGPPLICCICCSSALPGWACWVSMTSWNCQRSDAIHQRPNSSSPTTCPAVRVCTCFAMLAVTCSTWARPPTSGPECGAISDPTIAARWAHYCTPRRASIIWSALPRWRRRCSRSDSSSTISPVTTVSPSSGLHMRTYVLAVRPGHRSSLRYARPPLVSRVGCWGRFPLSVRREWRPVRCANVSRTCRPPPFSIDTSSIGPMCCWRRCIVGCTAWPVKTALRRRPRCATVVAFSAGPLPVNIAAMHCAPSPTWRCAGRVLPSWLSTGGWWWAARCPAANPTSPYRVSWRTRSLCWPHGLTVRPIGCN